LVFRRLISLCVLLGLLVAGWLVWRNASLKKEGAATPEARVDRQPVTAVTRTFDPVNPPPEMPPLAAGENAECESNFLSSADVGGETRQLDTTHGTVTITHVKVNLQLKITIWVPPDVNPHVADHEDGHRRISEYYYQSADELAHRVAVPYLGKEIEISGADLNAESSKALLQASHEIADEYSKEVNPEPTQLLYDSITDHGRSGVIAADAVSHALKNASVEAPASPANSGH